MSSVSELAINVYKFDFVSKCPSDGEMIDYKGEIVSSAMIRVEEINAFAKSMESGFHENIADKMFDLFGGAQQLIAIHQGVEIVTRRVGSDFVSRLRSAEEKQAAPIVKH